MRAVRARLLGGVAAALLALLALLASACGGGGGEPLEAGGAAPGFAFADGDVAEGAPIDARFTCDGEDASPALSWEGVPDGTKELALLLEDPDAPGGVFTHWLVYALAPRETALPAGVPAEGQVGSPRLRQGRNDFGDAGYGGPCPPGGETHRYVFRLLALRSELGLESLADRAALLAAIEGRVLAEARLTATYSR